MDIIFHIDVNNAFLSWTALDLLNKGHKTDIRTICAVIGGDESKRRGIVLAKSQEAKKYGIHTGESLLEARKKCPKIEVFPPNYHWYQQNSNQLFKLLSKYTPDIEVASIDECYLDYGKVKKLYGDEIAFAYKLKDEIKNTLGFTVNIGIANNKLCAKMASDFTKPDRVHTLFMNEVEDKMWPLPIGDLFGIGKSSRARLEQIGIHTIGDLANSTVEQLYPYFKNQSERMIRHAKGISHSIVSTVSLEPKGISNETTLEKDMSDILEMLPILQAISENVGRALRKEGKYAHVVCVTLKDKYFKSYSHQMTLPNPTNVSREIYEASKTLLKEMWNREPIRLIGIRLDRLSDVAHYQVSLFDDVQNHEQDYKLDEVVDQVRAKYGVKSIQKASLIDTKISKKYHEK